MKYILLSTLLSIQLLIIQCTIDVNIPEYSYIANHLTLEECRLLVASLYFISYELPDVLPEAEKLVPEGIPCFKLLIDWNNSKDKWGGRGKSHVDLSNRLREVGRKDLADWLSATVFQKLIEDVNRTALDPTFIDEADNITYNPKVYRDKDVLNESEWIMYDTVLWIVVIGFVGTILLSCARLAILNCKKTIFSQKPQEEMVDLINYEFMASDENLINESEDEGKDDKNIENVISDNVDDDSCCVDLK